MNEHILETYRKYCAEEKYYEAYSYVLDYHDTFLGFFDPLTAEETMGIFVLFCREKDRERAIKLATILIDSYKADGNTERIMELSYHFTCNFEEPLADTSSRLIMKDGISAALENLENITDTMPDERMIVFYCANMLCFPGLAKDRNFAFTAIQNLTSHYNSEYPARTHIIACFLPYLKRGFEALEQRYRSFIGTPGMDADEISKYADECKEYIDAIFVDGHPVLEGSNPYMKDAERRKIDEYISMLREEELLKAELLSISEGEPFPAELKERHSKMLDYFLNMDIKDGNVDIMRVYHAVSAFAMCRYVDIVYTMSNIATYAEQLLSYEVGDFTYTGTISHMQVTILELIDVYELVDDVVAQYRAYVRYLELGNIHAKRTCFEDGLDSFIQSVKSDYFLYHGVISKSLKVAYDNDFSLSPLYLEMCKRKNLLYLGEMWQRKGSSAVEIRRQLKNDFSFEELCLFLGTKNVLVDFLYIRMNTDDEQHSRDYVNDIANFACFAVIVKGTGEVQLRIVDKGADLAECIKNYEAETDYFGNIAEYILEDVEAQTLIVCADGDVNQLSIAALPFYDGYVTDEYAVRNIGSVSDLLFPNKRKPIKSALLFCAPEYAPMGSEQQDTPWKFLNGSEIEGFKLPDTFDGILSINTDCLSGAMATKAGLLSKLGGDYGILHISTHGKDANGGISIITAGANITGVNTMVVESELSQFRLENVSIAVFALCYGAKQDSAIQDSLSGFIKMSLLAGANTVIAPISPADDMSAAVLLNEFYKIYLSAQCGGDRISPEQALKRAIQRMRTMNQQEIWDEYEIDFKHDESYPYDAPRYWASWVCFSKEDVEE